MKDHAMIPLVLGYRRVSTTEQADRSYSPPVQSERIERYTEETFADTPYEYDLYEDLGTTGGFGLRQHPDLFPHARQGISDAIDHAVREASHRPVHLVTLDQSRLERDPLTWAILEAVYMKRHGIVFHLVDEGGPVDLAPQTRMLRGMRSLSNSAACADGGRRVAQAAQYRAALGFHGAEAPYGWRRVPARDGDRRKDIEPDPEQAELLCLIRDKVLDGASFYTVAQWLDGQGIPTPRDRAGWQPETIRGMLLNRVHCGFVRHREDWVQGRHFDLRLWEPELTHELERIISQRKRYAQRGVRSGEFLLNGMMVCGHCGQPLISCFSRAQGGRRQHGCQGKTIPTSKGHPGFMRLAEAYEEAVVDTVRVALSTGIMRTLTVNELETIAAQQLKDLAAEEQRVQRQHDEAGRSLADLVTRSRQAEMSDTAYRAAWAALEARANEAGARLEQLQSERKSIGAGKVRLERARKAADDFSRQWEHLTSDERRGLLQALIEEITVRKEGRRLELVVRFHFLPAATRTVLPGKGSPQGDGVGSLSARELAFLELWSRGLREPEIARAFEVTPCCVVLIRKAIAAKLEVGDTDEAVRIARPLIDAQLHSLPLRGRLNKRAHSPDEVTPAQRAVLAALAEGLSCQEAATALTVSRSAVYSAISMARKRLGAKSTQEAIQLAREQGVIV